ncbi:unnamed protein product, partial [Dovyalis caffra]
GDRICFNKQLQNHKIIVEQMANVLGNNESAARYLTKCLYSIGFKVPNSPCCQVTDIGQCIPNRIPCQNRNEYKFWDAFHPTEAANILTAVTTYSTLKSSDVFSYCVRVWELVEFALWQSVLFHSVPGSCFGGPAAASREKQFLDIGELLGFRNFTPSFLTASGSNILKGVNYASGSAGIRDETGKQLGINIELNKQLQNHQVIISRIVDMLGNESATKHLSKCLYSFVIGSNDYLNNYFMPKYYNTSSQFTPEQYATVLIKQYSQQIKSLYNSGARMVALTGIGPIGCTPHAIDSYGTNGSLCVDYMNDAVNHFNNQLQSLVNQFNKDLVDAKFIYLNTYGILSSEYPASPGIVPRIHNIYRLKSVAPVKLMSMVSALLVKTHVSRLT